MLLALWLAAFCVGSRLRRKRPPGRRAVGQPQAAATSRAQTPPAQAAAEKAAFPSPSKFRLSPMDVVATTNHGDILTGLKKENFRLFEDGVPQTITNFGPTDAPITMVIVMEFSAALWMRLRTYAKYWADALFPNLKPQD